MGDAEEGGAKKKKKKKKKGMPEGETAQEDEATSLLPAEGEESRSLGCCKAWCHPSHGRCGCPILRWKMRLPNLEFFG